MAEQGHALASLLLGCLFLFVAAFGASVLLLPAAAVPVVVSHFGDAHCHVPLAAWLWGLLAVASTFLLFMCCHQCTGHPDKDHQPCTAALVSLGFGACGLCWVFLGTIWYSEASLCDAQLQTVVLWAVVFAWVGLLLLACTYCGMLCLGGLALRAAAFAEDAAADPRRLALRRGTARFLLRQAFGMPPPALRLCSFCKAELLKSEVGVINSEGPSLCGRCRLEDGRHATWSQQLGEHHSWNRSAHDRLSARHDAIVELVDQLRGSCAREAAVTELRANVDLLSRQLHRQSLQQLTLFGSPEPGSGKHSRCLSLALSAWQSAVRERRHLVAAASFAARCADGAHDRWALQDCYAAWRSAAHARRGPRDLAFAAAAARATAAAAAGHVRHEGFAGSGQFQFPVSPGQLADEELASLADLLPDKATPVSPQTDIEAAVAAAAAAAEAGFFGQQFSPQHSQESSSWSRPCSPQLQSGVSHSRSPSGGIWERQKGRLPEALVSPRGATAAPRVRQRPRPRPMLNELAIDDAAAPLRRPLGPRTPSPERPREAAESYEELAASPPSFERLFAPPARGSPAKAHEAVAAEAAEATAAEAAASAAAAVEEEAGGEVDGGGSEGAPQLCTDSCEPAVVQVVRDVSPVELGMSPALRGVSPAAAAARAMRPSWSSHSESDSVLRLDGPSGALDPAEPWLPAVADDAVHSDVGLVVDHVVGECSNHLEADAMMTLEEYPDTTSEEENAEGGSFTDEVTDGEVTPRRKE